jgi:predicted nucleic acid-binding protein
MKCLLDTNVVSEQARREPHAGVARWLARQWSGDLHISVITLGELRRGILLLEDGARRRKLQQWLEIDLEPAFEGRIVSIDAKVISEWAVLKARTQRAGRPLPDMDALIAATALAHSLTLATRNVTDFAASGVLLVNPWQA